MTLRAFAHRKGVRFLAATDDPTRVLAQERCTPPHADRHFWHSAGYVLLSDLRLAAKHNLNVRWLGPRSCWRPGGHNAEFRGHVIVRLLVALDASLDRGMPVMRKLPDLGTPLSGVTP